MRAAIYARMSTDKQSADSPADQVARCREFAAARGWTVVESLVTVDSGISGASRHNRPGLLGLVERIDEWDVLLCWDSSRLARDSEDLGWIRNKLRAHRRTGYDVSNGQDLLNIAAKVMGIMHEEYLVKLRSDTQRGLRGRVESGLSAGGRPYGYRTEPILSGRTDAHGQPIAEGFRLVPDPAQAEVVRRIFEDYAQGDGLRTIAHRLNAEDVPPPRPRAQRDKAASWTVSSVLVLLGNPIYRGDDVWNRSEWIKDHDTGKRRRFERPEGEWVRRCDESWRVVSDALWQRVQARRRAPGPALPRRPDGRLAGGVVGQRSPTARQLLGGLLACGECGGGFFAVTRGCTYGCGWHRDRGPDVCASTLRVPRVSIEERILDALRSRVLTPETIGRAAERAAEKVLGKLRARDGATAADRKRLAELGVEIENATRLAVKAGHVEAVARVLDELETERVQIEQRLAASEPIVVDLDALRERVDRYAHDLRAAFDRAPEQGRTVLDRLLAGRRMAIHADAERGFRVEGLFELSLGLDSHRRVQTPATCDGRRPAPLRGPGVGCF